MAKIFDLDFSTGDARDKVSLLKPTAYGNPKIAPNTNGLAMVFNGKSNYIEYPSDINLGKTFTIISWVKIISMPSSRSILTKDISNTYRIVTLISIQFRINNVSYVLSIPAGKLRLNKVISITLTRDQTSLKLYINDEFISSAAISENDNINFTFNKIGVRDSDLYFYGDIYRISCYDAELSLAEITNDYIELLNRQTLSQPKTNFYYPKPNQEKDKKIGNNIILNPEFQGSSNWGTLGTVEFEDGKASVIRRAETPNSVLYQSTLTVGKKYLSRIYIDSDTTGSSKIFVNSSYGGPNDVISTTTDDGRTFASSSTVGWCEFTFVAEKDTVGVGSPYTSGATGKIDITKFYVIELKDKPEIQYNMTNAKGKLLNLANNNMHGTISSGVVQTPEGLKFDGVNSGVEISASALSGINSIQFRMKPNKKVREAIFSGIFSNNIIFIDEAGLVGAGSRAKVGDASNTAIKEGVWVNVQMVKHDIDTYSIWFDGVDVSGGSSSGYRATAFTAIGRCSPNLPFSGELADVRMFAEKLTAQDAKDYHNQFSTQALLIDGFKFEPTNTGQNVVPKGWTRLAGGFKIDTDAVGDTVLMSKYNNSIIYLPLGSLDTYTVEFDFVQPASGSYIYVSFLNSNTLSSAKGYAAVAGYRVRLYRVNGNSRTSLGYSGDVFGNGSVKFTRDFFGEMKSYIKNIDGEYELLPFEGGTNPVTDTTYTNLKYLVIEVPNLHGIKNLRIYKGVKV